MRFTKSSGRPAPQSVSSAQPPPGAGWSATLIAGIALTLVVIVLAVQNTERTHLELFGWESDTPLVVILLSAALIGVVFDEIAGVLWRRRRRRQIAEREELTARRAATTRAVETPDAALTDGTVHSDRTKQAATKDDSKRSE